MENDTKDVRKYLVRIFFTTEEVRRILKSHGLEVRKIENNTPEKPLSLLAEALNDEMGRRLKETWMV